MTGFEQPWFSETSAYEAAVMAFLPDAESEAVKAARAVAGDAARRQMEPHCTLLYLGHMSGRNLQVMAEEMRGVEWPRLTVRVSGVGTFTKYGRITNVHLQLEPSPEILETHRRAHAAASRHPWFSPGAFVADGYVPHISIVDRVSLAEVDRDDPRLQTWVGRSIALPEPSLASLRLDPVVLFRRLTVPPCTTTSS